MLTPLVYLIVGLAATMLVGYMIYSQTNIYFKRGRKKAYQWVARGLITVDEQIAQKLDNMKQLRDQVFKVALEADQLALHQSIDAFDKRIQEINARNAKLIDKRDALAEKPIESTMVIDDGYYVGAEDAVKDKLAEIDKELKELGDELSQLQERTTEAMSESVGPWVASTQKWFQSILHNLSVWSKEVSNKLLVLFLWAVEFSIGLYLFKELFLAYFPDVMAYVVAGGLTLSLVVVAHTVYSHLRSIVAGRFLVNLVIPGILLLLTILLVLYVQLFSDSIAIPRVLMWTVFVGLIHYVALRSTDTRNPFEVAMLIRAPLLLLINTLVIIPAAIILATEKGIYLLVNIFRSSPISERERSIKNRIAELGSDKDRQNKEMNDLRAQCSTFRKGEVSRMRQEGVDKIKLESQAMDTQIESYNKSVGQLRSQRQIFVTNLDNLRLGSDAGTDAGVVVVMNRRAAAVKKDKK